MNEKIKKMIMEGKSLDDISIEMAKENKSIEEVLIGYKAAKMAVEVEKAEYLEKGKKLEEEIINKKVDAAIQKKLENTPAESIYAKYNSVNVDASGKLRSAKQLVRWNNATKSFMPIATPTEIYLAFNELIKAAMTKDYARANSISKEIEQDNMRYKAANDPIRTDNNTTGKYAVPTEVDREIHQLIYAGSAMLQLCNTDNLQYDSKIYPLMYNTAISDIADQTTAVTESQQTFTNPTVDMKRCGTYSNISNTIINKLGADVVNAVVMQIGSEFAKFMDLRLAVGNVTNSGDLVDGIVFDALTTLATEVAFDALTIKDLSTIKNQISYAATGKLAFVGNRAVKDKVGTLENTAGNLAFPNYVSNGECQPYGLPFVLNPVIPTTLDVSADKRTTGTDDVLIVADFSQIIAGISGTTRIDISDAPRFLYDATTVRAIKEYGIKVLSGTSTGGIVSVALGLTH